jgi:hypothetical protein
MKKQYLFWVLFFMIAAGYNQITIELLFQQDGGGWSMGYGRIWWLCRRLSWVKCNLFN